VGLAKPVSDYVDALVHASARHDALTAARHRAFIASRLFASVIAFAGFPAYIALRGVPGPIEVLVFAWLAAPILVAFYLSRTGEYERAQVLSAVALTGLGVTIAAACGGIGSFAAIWLIIVPLEAALAGSSRIVAFAATLAISAALLLLWLGAQDLLPASQASHALAALGVLSAALYATGLAFGAQSVARAGIQLLRTEQERNRLLAGNMTDAILRHDASGAIRYASPSAAPLLGIPIHDLLGQGLYNHVHVADRPAYVTALADAAEFGRVQTVELRVRRDMTTSGAGVNFTWTEMRCSPASTSAPGEVVAVMRDIGERKAQEKSAQDMREYLAQTNDANSRLLATLGHELRTPLNAIIGFSQVLSNPQSNSGDADQWRNYARLINESGTHLLSVVDGMLDVVKIENGNLELAPQTFAPAPAIKDCCDLLLLAIKGAGLKLDLRLGQRLPDIVADPRAFKQILINLISNAVKFTDRGGQITVSASAEVDTLDISVEDTGIGIASEDIPSLGKPSFRAKSAQSRPEGGAGLGLSIVMGLVALHGGQFDIRSRLGEGTRVTVRLPNDCRKLKPSMSDSARALKQAAENVDNKAASRVKKSASA
jgi:cell cycle sensor histidine kinase DivJ